LIPYIVDTESFLSADIQEMEQFPGRSRSIDTIFCRYVPNISANIQEMEHFPAQAGELITFILDTVPNTSDVIQEMEHFPRLETDHWYSVPS
jgi:hypothetical protein